MLIIPSMIKVIDVLHGAGHPDLSTIGTSINKKCIQARNKNASSQKRATSTHTSTSAKTQKETKKLGYTDVTEYVLDSSIKTLKELQSIAIKHKNEGKNNLFSFLSQNSLDVSDLIDRT